MRFGPRALKTRPAVTSNRLGPDTRRVPPPAMARARKSNHTRHRFTLYYVTSYVILGGMSTVITKDDAKELFKANIRDVLKERGMSQGDLARVLFDGDDCVNNRMKVSRWCNAAVSPTLWELANIAEALDIPIGRLFAARTNGRKKLSKK